MYFSDNEYYSLVESIKDLNNFTVLQQQSLTDNTKILLSLNNSYQNNAQAILKLLLQGIGQKSQERSEKIIEIDLRDCPEIKHTFKTVQIKFKIRIKRQLTNYQFVNRKQNLEQNDRNVCKVNSKCFKLQKNASFELALKDEVEIMRKKTQQLNEALQQHSIKIQHEERVNQMPVRDLNDNFEQESLNLLKNLKDDYIKQLKQLQQSQKVIRQFNEALE